jgi:hypothetical protein
VTPSEYLRRHGWCQGIFEGEDGRVCALGAWRRSQNLPILTSCLDLPVIEKITYAQEEWAQKFVFVGQEQFPHLLWMLGDSASNEVAEFNDNPETSVDDVLLVMEKIEVG